MSAMRCLPTGKKNRCVERGLPALRGSESAGETIREQNPFVLVL